MLSIKARLMAGGLVVGLLPWIGYIVGLAGYTRESFKDYDGADSDDYDRAFIAMYIIPQYLLVALYIPVLLFALFDIYSGLKMRDWVLYTGLCKVTLDSVIVTLSYSVNIAFLITYGASLIWAIISVANSGYSVDSEFNYDDDNARTQARKMLGYAIVELISLVGLMGLFLVYLCLRAHHKQEKSHMELININDDDNNADDTEP